MVIVNTVTCFSNIDRCGGESRFAVKAQSLRQALVMCVRRFCLYEDDMVVSERPFDLYARDSFGEWSIAITAADDGYYHVVLGERPECLGHI